MVARTGLSLVDTLDVCLADFAVATMVCQKAALRAAKKASGLVEQSASMRVERMATQTADNLGC